MRMNLLAAAIACTLYGPVLANDQPRHCDKDRLDRCQLPEQHGKLIANSTVRETGAAPANTELHSVAPNDAGDCKAAAKTPAPAFRISVDGVPLDATAGKDTADAQRCTDLALARADIQIRYDSGEQTPWLNAHATPNAIVAGQAVRFTTYSNYAAWISKAELRLFASDRTPNQKPLAVVPVDINGIATWTTPDKAFDTYAYVLRVYAKDGKFDETRAKPLNVVRNLPAEQQPIDDVLAGYGENSLALHNIPVKGGAVTVNGTRVQTGDSVQFMGGVIPVDKEGKFAARQILPPGPHTVAVTVRDAKGDESRFTRNLTIADDDWFYIGLADLTLGHNSTSGPIQLVTGDEGDHYDNSVYIDGRLAFYLKGKIKGKYLLTAAADSREQPLKDLFSNFASKDPRYLLRRLDAERYYPVYGDDSTTLEDAPTQGKFFVKVERGDSQVMWGNFQTSLTGTEFVQYNRGLYGARAKLVTDDTTAYGEKRGGVEAFVADPGSLPGRDEFRGTGGSLYYLRRQEVTQGSERVWIEVRDKDTGLVLETRYLTPSQDYDVNYLQGRVLLRESLGSTAGGGTLIRSGALSGHFAYLVISYEYTPGLASLDDLVDGGRAQYWINDQVGLGVTGYRQDGTGMWQRLGGADLTLRYQPGTYLKIEGAHSEGPGSGANLSQDGGYNFSGLAAGDGTANAKRIEAATDFSELNTDLKGRAKVYWQDREAGFSGPGQITGSQDLGQQGAAVDWSVTEQTTLTLKADQLDADTRRVRAAEMDIHHELNENWAIATGIRNDDRQTDVASASPLLDETGQRTDVIVRGEYRPDTPEDQQPDWSAYSYLQGTAARSGSRSDNDRFGIGGTRQVSKRVALTGEASAGDGGFGALARGDYLVDDNNTLYLNYALDTDRTDTGYRGRQGLLSTGGRSRFSDSVSVFGEERLQHGDGPSGLTHAYGVELTPNERWNYGFTAEAGTLSDPLIGDMDRKAFGASIGFHRDTTKFASNLEYRDEQATIDNRRTWLMRNTLGYQVDPEWRYLGRLNFSFSESSAGAFYDGNYVEFVTGYAYRPVDNDKWNALLKYTYFLNLPSPGQLTPSDSIADYAQRSHVLSADGIYDIRPWVSIGGKYGLRLGELRDTRSGGDWQSSLAQLAILRADFHWVHNWDVVVEGRVLDLRAAEDRRSGMLLGVYRHVTDHVKVGVGYNFSDFSDDLTDLSYRSEGWFVNVIGKF